MNTRLAVLFIAAALITLGGCSTYTVIPEGMTAEEAKEIIAAQEAARAAAPKVIVITTETCFLYYGSRVCGFPPPVYPNPFELRLDLHFRSDGKRHHRHPR